MRVVCNFLSLALISYPWFTHHVIELFTVILKLFYCVSSLYNCGTGRGTAYFHMVCFSLQAGATRLGEN